MSRAAVVAAVISAAGCSGGRAAPTGPAAAASPQFLAINQPGELVDVEAALVPGRITIVDFRADWCGGCVVVEDRVRAAVTGDPRIAVRIVDIGDGDSPIAKAYGIRGLPHVLVVDGAGALRYRLIGNDALTAGEVAVQLAAEP